MRAGELLVIALSNMYVVLFDTVFHFECISTSRYLVNRSCCQGFVLFQLLRLRLSTHVALL